MNKLPKYKNLGWQNGWDSENAPQDYLDCCHKQHQPEITKIGKCQYQAICHICKIYYKWDSGD